MNEQCIGKTGNSSWILSKCSTRTGSGLCQSPESRLKVGRSDSFHQRTFHQFPVHDGRSARLAVRKVSIAECGGLSGWRHVLLPLTVVANHNPWGVEMDRMEKMKAGPSFTAQRQPSRRVHSEKCRVAVDELDEKWLCLVLRPHRG